MHEIVGMSLDPKSCIPQRVVLKESKFLSRGELRRWSHLLSSVVSVAFVVRLVLQQLY